MRMTEGETIGDEDKSLSGTPSKLSNAVGDTEETKAAWSEYTINSAWVAEKLAARNNNAATRLRWGLGVCMSLAII